MASCAPFRLVIVCIIAAGFFTTVMPQLVGSHQSTDANDYKEDAAFAISLLNTKSDVPNRPVRLAEIMTASTQVVAGTNVRLNLKVVDSEGILRVYQVNLYHKLPQDRSNSPAVQMTSYDLLDTLGAVSV